MELRNFHMVFLNLQRSNAYVVGALAAIAIVVSVVLLTLVSSKNAPSQTTEPEATLQINTDGTALVKGLVLENNLGCVRDGICYLLLRASGEDIRVVYHEGEGEQRCLNEIAIRDGMAVRAGMVVTALGKYQGQKALHVINLCAYMKSYLTVDNHR